jgi:hypothetical protein
MEVKLAAEMFSHAVVAVLYTLVSAGKKYFTILFCPSSKNVCALSQFLLHFFPVISLRHSLVSGISIAVVNLTVIVQ